MLPSPSDVENGTTGTSDTWTVSSLWSTDEGTICLDRHDASVQPDRKFCRRASFEIRGFKSIHAKVGPILSKVG